jgi:hypothetical protein
MNRRFQQFLGTAPGIVVELVNDTTSPYRLRTEDGFEFSISADDFRNYYRPVGMPTPDRWSHLITDEERGVVESGKISEVMSVIHASEESFQDFERARAFLRDAAILIDQETPASKDKIRLELEKKGWKMEAAASEDVERLMKLPEDIRRLLKSDTCAVITLPTGAPVGESAPGRSKKPLPQKAGGPSREQSPNPAAAGPRSATMKNAVLNVEKDLLTITVDLSREMGPSKSGKTTIIASSEGNKSIPGRVEKIGLNVYRAPSARSAKGRRTSFKNVELDVKGDILTIRIDLSQEFGLSKSGKTTIVASTEGNQLVYGREEKIGLNVYRKA